jgi:tRNA dimethylallyltransferase
MVSSRHPQPLVVVCGATGVGKTRAAIALGEAFGGEVVGADSMQLYRHMDIGTAKPTPAEQKRVRHHLIDILDPDQQFDAARYAESARKTIGALHERGILPIVAGGTGLYIRALMGGISPLPRSDPAARARLWAALRAEGSEALHRRLAACDPHSAARIHTNDAYRIVRALEVHAATGRPLSDHQRRHGFGDCPYRALQIGLEMERQALYRRIDRRVEAMVAAGLVEEVRSLRRRGYGGDLKSMRSLGYRHMLAFLEEGLPWEEAVRTLKRDTRRYAKRQMTWFKADGDVTWVPAEKTDELIRLVGTFLESPDERA